MYKEIFNFMAELIKKIIDKVDDAFYQKYNAMTQKRSDRFKETLQKELPGLYEDNSCCFDKIFDEEMMNRLQEFVDKRSAGKEYAVLVKLLSRLDYLLADYLLIYVLNSEQHENEGWVSETPDDEITFCLNTNYEECKLQLLPRCSCVWMHKSRDKVTTYSINNYLNHCYYIATDKLGDYRVENHFLSMKFERARKRGYLVIGMTPLCNNAQLKVRYSEDEGTNYFEVLNISDINKITEYVRGQLDQASKEDVDILCFPEMLGSQAVIDAIQEKLQDFPEDNKKYPKLIVGPTIWKENKNICFIIDGFGSIITKQEKQHPFPYCREGNEYLEKIVPDKVISLLHCEGIGRIAVMICKDALQREYLQMILEHLKVTLLLIPSFSTGNFDFEEIMQTCRSYDCCVAWINTCSVQLLDEQSAEKLDKIGIVLRTGKVEGALKNDVCYFIRQKQGCDGKGEKACASCVYTQRLLFKNVFVNLDKCEQEG